MSGLGRLVSGLGAVAGGMAEGMRQKSLMDARNFYVERDKKRAEEEDRQLALDREAQRAGSDYLEQRRQSAMSTQGPVNQYLTQGGSDGSMPDQSAIDQAPPPAKPWQPPPEDRAGAMQAHIDKLFAQGRVEKGLQGMVHMEQTFGPIRQKAVNDGLAAFKLNGDPTSLIKAYNDYLPDGQQITLVNQTESEDGRPMYVAKVKNNATGKERPLVMSADQVEQYAQQMIDPKTALLHSFQSRMLAKRDADAAKRQEAGKAADHARAMDVVNKRGENALAVANVNRDGRIAAARAGSGSRAESAGLLREQRLAAESDVKALLDLLQNTRRPQERAALQAQLTTARQRVRDLGDKIGGYADERFGAGAGRPTAKPLAMPASKSQLKPGQTYQTARGVARWNGSEFELEE